MTQSLLQETSSRNELFCEIEESTKWPELTEECWTGVSDSERVHTGITIIPVSQKSEVKNARHACHAQREALQTNEVGLFEEREWEHGRKSRDVRKCEDSGASASSLKGSRLHLSRGSSLLRHVTLITTNDVQREMISNTWGILNYF